MECCGQDRTTKFCCECGTPVGLSPLGELLRHCRTAVKMKQSTANGYREDTKTIGRSDFSIVRCKLAADRADNNAGKWQSWADELEKAIAALAEKESKDAT